MKITSRIVENYLNCKYKAQLALKGETGTPHDYEVLVGELQAEYRPKATEALLRRQNLESAPTIPSVTITDLQQGHPLILDCTVENDQFQFHFDALKRVDSREGTLILTDMFGGTPSNISLSFLEEGKVEVVTGVNLPMLIKLVTYRQNKTLSDLANFISQYGRKNINLATDVLNPKKAE